MTHMKVGQRIAVINVAKDGLAVAVDGKIVRPGAHIDAARFQVTLDRGLSKDEIAQAAFAAGVRLALSESRRSRLAGSGDAA